MFKFGGFKLRPKLANAEPHWTRATARLAANVAKEGGSTTDAPAEDQIDCSLAGLDFYRRAHRKALCGALEEARNGRVTKQ